MSVNRLMDKEDVVYTYNGIIFSYFEKNETLPFAATWMDIEGIMLGEMSDKERQTSYDITWMWNLKNTRNY